MSSVDDLNNLLNSDLPTVVLTPYLPELMKLSSEKRLRKIAELTVKHMVKTFNNSEKAKIPRTVTHDGHIIEVRYLHIETLFSGVWPSVSLMLLNLNVDEQLILIDSLYPKNTQLAAKEFAVTFSNKKVATSVDVKSDPDIVDKLDSANSGIAMILAILQDNNNSIPHPDNVNMQLKQMNTLVKQDRQARTHKEHLNRAKESNKWRDRQL